MAVNRAKFTINSTPSEDPSTGDPKFVATNSQTLTLQLETQPSAALSALFEVYSSADSNSPLASFNATTITFSGSGTYQELLTDPSSTATIVMPASGVHSYTLRCTASFDTGPEVFERIVYIEKTSTTPNIRKTIPSESTEARARGWSDDLNNMVDAISAGAGSGDVVGPGSATDNAISRFDGTSGKLIQNSGVTIDDSNNVSGVVNQVSTGYYELTDMSAPGNPGAGLGRLYKKTSDDGLFWKPDAAGPEVDLTSDVGEANTASNAGSGTSLYYQKTGVDLEFNGIKSENALLTVSLDGVSHDVELTVNEGSIDHNNLTGLQGGTSSEYYHLTNTRHTDLTDGGDSTLHYHATDRARANHTGTQLEATVVFHDSTGHTHTGSGNDGTPIDHTDLTTIGTNTHAQIDTHIASTSNPHSVTASQVSISEIGTATYDDVQGFIQVQGSAGATGSSYITDAGGATIDVAAGQGFIRTTDSPVGVLQSFDWSSSTGISIPSNTIRYVGVEYNSGSPQVVVKTSDTWDDHTDFRLGSVVNESGTLHILNNPQKISNGVGRTIHRLYETLPFQRADRLGGLILTETGTRNLAVSAGELYDALNEFDITAKDTSAADTFDRYYRDGVGGWTKQTGQTQWDNTQYDDGSGSLATMTNNRFSNQWFYLEADDVLVSLYGQAEYVTQAAAEDEGAPSSVPNRLSAHGLLIGRVVFQKSGGSALEVQSVYTTTLSGAGTSNHNELGGIQGGAAGDYYHFTGTQHTDLTDAGDSTLHYHAADRARANHTGTQAESTVVFDDSTGHTHTGSGNDGTVIDHTDLSTIGTNTHSQIDTHIASTSNPHSTDIGNIGSGTLAELNAAITDATLDDSSDPRTDNDAIHDNVASEISAVTLKSTPVSGDFLLIEDSADSNNKKRITIGTIPGSGDVTGPGSSTDNAVVRFDGTSGKLIKDSSTFIYDGTSITLNTGTIALEHVANGVAIGENAGNVGTVSGISNVTIGYDSGTALTTGARNVGLGKSTLAAVVSGDDNVALGDSALTVVTSSANVAVGSSAGSSLTSGSGITAIGYQSLSSAATTTNSTATGHQALQTATGNNNTGFGHTAGSSITTGADNTVLGVAAGASVGTGDQNVFAGVQAGQNSTNTNYSTGIGYQALQGATGAANTAVGLSAGSAIGAGTNNVAVGYQSLDTGAGSTGNVAIGYRSLRNVQSNYNVAIGYEAGDALTSGGTSVAVGHQALSAAVTATANTAVGYQSGLVLTGSQNTLYGYKAGTALTTASDSVFIGFQAGDGITANNYNTAVGSNSLSALAGGQNVAVGYSALGTSTSASSVAVGYNALTVASGNFNVAVGANAGVNQTTTNGNTLIGYNTGNQVTDGENLVLVGYGAGDAITTGDWHTAVGYNALSAISTNSGCTAVGTNALILATGPYNVAVGAFAGDAVTSGSNNVLMGFGAGGALTTGGSNTAIGHNALLTQTTVNNSVAVGVNALTLSTAGSNTAVGAAAGAAATTGASITLIGYQAGTALTTGGSNTALGYQALSSESTTDGNTALGYQAMDTASGSSYNVAAGYRTLQVASGTNNVAIGREAGKAHTSTEGSVYIGARAGLSTTGTQNTLIGYNSGDALTTGGYNTAIGAWSLSTSITGASNVAIGHSALTAATGSYNIAIGANSGLNQTTSSGNVFIGHTAGNSVTDGANLVAIGYQAGDAISTGDRHTVLGYGALSSVSTNSDCTAIGYNALNASTAANNTAVGSGAGSTIDTGANNTLLGYNAGNSITSGADNIVIGNDVDTSGATVSNELNIGDTIFGDLANARIRVGGSGAMSGDASIRCSETDSAFMPNVLTTTQRNAITPEDGMVIYNSTDSVHQFRQNSAWVDVPQYGPLWNITTQIDDGDSPYASSIGELVRVNPLAANTTITLPDITAASKGRAIAVKVQWSTTNLYEVLVTPDSTDTIDDVWTIKSPMVMDVDLQWAILVSDGVDNWLQMG